MAEIEYRQYTPEEDKIYYDAIAKIKAGFQNGLNFNEACGAVPIEDEELKLAIVDDALKILIAELHYGEGMPFAKLSERLKLPLKTIETAMREMMQDVEISAVDVFRRMNPGSPVGNA